MEVASLQIEIAIIKYIDNPRVVKLIEVLEDSQHLYIVMELLPDSITK